MSESDRKGMESLKKDRRYQRLSLTRVKAQMEEICKQKSVSVEAVAKLESLLETYFNPAMQQFSECTQKFVTLLGSTEEDEELETACLDEVDEMREVGAHFQAKVKSFQMLLSEKRVRESLVPAKQPRESLVGAAGQHQFTKIKEIEPPTFNGDLTKFFEWKNLFVNLIHSRPQNEMGNTLKMYYLKKAMVGDADGILSDFELSDAGYVLAWDFVIFRFEKRRSIVKAFFRKLQLLEPIKDERSLQKLLDATNSVIRGLTAAGEEINDSFSRYLAFHTSTKLDAATLKDWEDSLSSTDTYPKFDQMSKFLQCRAFAAEERLREKEFAPPPSKESKRDKKSFSASVVRRPKCVVCSQSHYLNQCGEFKSKSPQERYEVVKKFKLCLICFDARHGVSECKSKFACNCGSRHSPLLHFESRKSGAEKSASVDKSAGGDQSDSATKSADKQSYSCVQSHIEKFVVLPSAVVKFTCNGVVGRARVLLDSCSQPTMVSDLFVRKFRLPVLRSEPSIIGGVGENSVRSASHIGAVLSSRFGGFELAVEADVVPASSIAYTAAFAVPTQVCAELKKFPLADPAWTAETLSIDRVDMIIGGEFYEKIIRDESHWVGELKLRRTWFGFTVAGVAPAPINQGSLFVGCTLQEIDQTLRRYWEVEEANYQESAQSLESAACVEHFEKFTQIAVDGKFLARLPFKVPKSQIGNNRQRALANFYHVERSLSPDVWSACVRFLVEYLEAGHMSVADAPVGDAYYIPYRPVIRESSTTTPCRVVFNASSRGKGQMSLNEGLMKGPVIQRDLFDILISMRSFRVVVCADIKQMYRMVWVHPDDRDMQRIFFRQSPSEPVREYRLNTVTYGTTPASFVATKCLEVIACSLDGSNPEAARIVRECFYMDDLIFGGDSFGAVLELQKVVHAALLERGFLLRKYSSSSRELLERLPSELLAESALCSFEEESHHSTVLQLGVTWSPSIDSFGVKVDSALFPENFVVTKRIALSYTSRVFDPLGFVSPVTVRGKLLLQSLWLEGRTWDEPVSPALSEMFFAYIRELSQLSALVIPRPIYSAFRKQIVAFCDASDKAYCAVLYLRSVDPSGNVFCRMICSKTRIAPVRSLTIPKLELMAANLLVELIGRIAPNLKIEFDNIFAFSDSTIVLCWLSQPAESWRTFVCNRVKKIVNVIPYRNWFYVSTECNPADFGTRGLNVNDFLKLKTWFDGPDFLSCNDPFNVFKIPNVDVSNALEKRKTKFSFCAASIYDFVSRFSSFDRLIRSVAYILRFFNGCKRRERFVKRVVETAEFLNALNIVFCFVQSLSFRSEIERLRESLPVKNKSTLKTLNPVLDQNGVLRVGGRLDRSEFSEEKKHPIILSAKSQFTKLLCRHVHEKYFHAGRLFLASFFSSRYWIVGGRTNLFKFVIRTCVTCTRVRAERCEQLMGQLPPAKVSISRPFAHCGVDFAGPFSCKCTAHRSTRFTKVYIAVFICLAVRAVHIEIVSDLSSQRFLEAMQRFIARRGIPAVMYSDNGTNFVGARNFFELDREKLLEFSTAERFKWQFIPPRAPNFGGAWEAAVKSAKKHLLNVTHGVTLSYEEYGTLFARVEAMMNSRPLCYRDLPAQGVEALTPGHFLIGRPFTMVAGIDSLERISLTNRLLLIQNQLRGFWQCWSKDYINQMQQRAKWQQEQPNLEVGQLVLVRNENTKPFDWPLGVIEAVQPGKDGLVRVVDVRFQGSVLSRSVSSIIVLPVSAEPPGSAGGVC